MTTTRVASSRVQKDSNGDIGEHLRNHIHLTNSIHLKNHMHNKHGPVSTDRSLLMRDLVLLQRSRSLRDPSANRNSPSSNGVVHKEGTRRRRRRRSVYSVASVKSKDRANNIKTLSDQLNEVLGDDSDDVVPSNVPARGNGPRRRKFRGARRAGRAVTVRDNVVGIKSEMSLAEKYEEEEGTQREQDMTRAVPRNGCGLPFNWSRIHHRGRTFLDIAGRSLSCGMSDSKGRKGLTDISISSASSSSFTKPDRKALPLLVDSGDNEGWQHDYSGELGVFADDLLKNGEKSSSRNPRRHHQSFTQKYAPRTFQDVVGQSLVVQALSNAVAKRRVGLLYVFHGSNGSGKTSCARVFARALNCHSPEHSKPCGVCSSCVSYDNGKNKNIREMGPVRSFDFENLISQKDRRHHHKVFIFEDCDAMSTACWNALSKVVDRAPSRVVFILVCSSLDALPHIVVSRCQRFFFPKLKDADIIGSLQRIASKEEIDIDKDALKLVASRSDGSLRDAEMTLEQLSLLGTRISVPLVQELVISKYFYQKSNTFFDTLSADTVNTVKNLRMIMETGVEPLALMSQLATVITDILAGSYDFAKDQHKRKFFRRHPLCKEDMEKLRQALKTLSESEKQLRVSNDKITWLTAALLQLAPDQRYLLPPGSSANASFNPSPSPCKDAAGEVRGRSGEGFSSVNRPSVEDIWLAVVENVRVNGLREFLYREGKIFSISIGSAPTVQLMFNSPVTRITAENFRDHILGAFEAVLGAPVTLEIRIESKKDQKNLGGRSEIIELEDESESAVTREANKNKNQSIVRGKVSLAQVIKQGEGSSWSKRKALLIAEKLEHENLRLESRSRILICWKALGSVRRKLWRLKMRTRRVRLHSLWKLVSSGKCLPLRSSIL
ncbi:BnaC09g18610D [Brassica napus]|uniref:BnaC09g18610D protein n=1 Tax=Brassica napus TaxID=3708 RepID=A0A078GDL0_BRANA|nr:BnaC09g18610D [Brassica napus]